MLRGIVMFTAVFMAVGCGGPGGARPERGGERAGATRPAAGRAPATATSATTRPTDRPVGPGLPEGWEIVPTSTLSARQGGGEVVITAKGENPTAGYETKLMQSVLRIWPPQYVLIRKKPAGVAAQVMTPFEVTARFKAEEPVPVVIVRDGTARHEVRVEQGAR